MSRILLILALLPTLASAEWAGLPRAELRIGGERLQVEVAATSEARRRGLMGRRELAPDAGMLFVYPAPNPDAAMWMRNTPLPLSVAFIDAEGRIINTARMTPLSDRPHHTAAPAKYALELNAGWFREHGVGTGDRIEGLDGVGER